MEVFEQGDKLWQFITNSDGDAKSGVPSISITPSRRVSVSSPLRFTRTFSEDSLDSIEKIGRKELRRKRMMMQDEKQDSPMCLIPSPSMCPHLGQMGRSRTEPNEPELTKVTPVLKRSTGDLSSRESQSSPTRKTLSEFIGLSPYQQKLLVQCWPNIYSTGSNGQFANAIYSKLTANNAKARQLLAKANGVAVFANNDSDCTGMHARVTLELIDTAIRSLDNDNSRLTAYLIEIGRCHRGLRSEGLGTGLWDEFGDAIIDCLRRYDSVRKHKELRRAWLALIAYIIDNLKQGQSILRASSSYEISDREMPSSPSSNKNLVTGN